MRTAHHGQPKLQKGISLIPDLWQALDKAAAQAGVPRNQVVETILMREFGLPTGNQKTNNNAGKVDSELVEMRP